MRDLIGIVIRSRRAALALPPKARALELAPSARLRAAVH
jgi:hypothetical protein